MMLPPRWNRWRLSHRHVLWIVYAVFFLLVILIWSLFMDILGEGGGASALSVFTPSFAPTYGAAEVMSYDDTPEFVKHQGRPPSDTPMTEFEKKHMANASEVPATYEPEKQQKILMLIVVQKGTKLATYSQALSSMECYAKRQGYDYRLVEDKEYPMCKQKDFMFRRHCIVLQFLPDYDFLVFLDGDMAVVNPDRRYEEWIDPNADLTLYERIGNWEFAAGSYIARNCEWTKEFLRLFADYETQIPRSFHGTDNGALHIFIAEMLYPDLHEDLKTCWEIYRKSRNYETLFIYEACVRNVMGFRRNVEHLKIMPKGTSWVRDIWLTDSRWSREHDFMLHALQQQRRLAFNSNMVDRANMGSKHLHYYDPFLPNANWSGCADPEFKWPLDERLIVANEVITSTLHRLKKQTEKERWKMAGKVEKWVY